MELTQLLQFKTIAECDTITQAAEKLHVSQPALSTMLKKLENELHVSLFDRKKNRVTLNSAGKLALAHTNAILDRVEQMKEDLSSYSRKENTFYAAFYDPGPMWYVVPQFSIAHPNIEFKAEAVTENENALDLLLNQKKDIVIGTIQIDSPEISSMPFLHDQLLLSVPTGHALSNKTEISLKENRPDALRSIIQLYVGGEWFEKIQKPFWKLLSPELELVLYDDFFVFSQIIRGTDAITTSTKLVKNYRDDGEGRTLIPLTDDVFSIVYYLSYLKKNADRLSPFLEWAKLLSENA